jgi:hypothetical protein
MLNTGLGATYDRFLLLMGQTREAIERKDMNEVVLLQDQVALLIAEMDTHFREAMADPTLQKDAASLEAPIRTALDSVTLNQIRLAGWLSDTGAELGRLQQGAAAVREYAASAPPGAPLFEQEA